MEINIHTCLPISERNKKHRYLYQNVLFIVLSNRVDSLSKWFGYGSLADSYLLFNIDKWC